MSKTFSKCPGHLVNVHIHFSKYPSKIMSWWKVGFGHKRHSIISYALTSSALPVAYSNSLGRSWWPWSYRGTSKGGRDGEKKAVSRWETPRLKCSVIVKTNWKPRSRGLKTSPRDPVNLCLIWSIDIRGGMDWKRPINAQRRLNIHSLLVGGTVFDHIRVTSQYSISPTQGLAGWLLLGCKAEFTESISAKAGLTVWTLLSHMCNVSEAQ